MDGNYVRVITACYYAGDYVTAWVVVASRLEVLMATLTFGVLLGGDEVTASWQQILVAVLTATYLRITNKTFDVIAISETWQVNSGDTYKTNDFLTNYNQFNTNRNNRRGGGVSIYAKSRFVE